MIPSLSPLTTRLRRRTAAVLAVALAGVLPLAVPTAPSAQADDRSAMAAAASGYWMVAADGGIFSFGDAKFFGSTGNIKLNQPIVGMASTPSGNGYWFVAADGGIFSFGDAKFFGSTGAMKLNKPIVGMAATPSGNGYWFVASDGGIFSFGDAPFFGSAGNVKLNKPITAMAATPSGKGYWFTASDGGVFSYGDAKFFGAAPQRPATGERTVAAMVPTPDGAGYWQASATGELLAFGSAGDLGGLSGVLARPIVGMTAVPAGVPSGPNTTQPPGGGTTTTTTITTTPTTLPPGVAPRYFSSTAMVSWGTPPDPLKSRVNDQGETVFPYAQKVAAIAEIGDRVYIGGSFADLVDVKNNDPKNRTPSGVPMDHLAELDTNGIAVPGSAFNATVTIDGPVRTLQRSADGRRLYVGGEFNRVNGEIHRRLVALDPATGQIDRSFNPPEPNAYVTSIVEHGSRVYIGGAFTSLEGTAVPSQLAALRLDGSLDNGFDPPARYTGRFEGQAGSRVDNPTSGDITGTIDSLLITRDGKYLMVGGSFLHFGWSHDDDPGHTHSGLIAVNPETGDLTSWQPVSSSSGSSGSRPVFGMTAYPGNPKDIGINAPDLIFAAAGGAGGRAVAWTPGGSSTALWRGGVDGDALSVAATRERLYLVGHFDYARPDPKDPCLQIVPVTCPTETPNRHLVAWDVRGEVVNGKNTGKAVFDPGFTAQANTSEGPYAVLIGANRMYVGGNFTEVASTPVGTGGQPIKQPGFAVYPPMP